MLRTALLAGATGLVGRRCLERLLSDADYQQVVTISRRPLDRAHSRLIELQIDFDALPDVACPVKIDDAYCALGTTMRKAGSKDAFARVDRNYVASFAKFSKAQGARTFVLVSALGADSESAGFYNRVKGQAEEAVKDIGFDAVHIMRPSLLVGERQESRLAERLGVVVGRSISPLLIGPLRRARPVQADKVAVDMISAAKASLPGLHIHYPSA